MANVVTDNRVLNKYAKAAEIRCILHSMFTANRYEFVYYLINGFMSVFQGINSNNVEFNGDHFVVHYPSNSNILTDYAAVSLNTKEAIMYSETMNNVVQIIYNAIKLAVCNNFNRFGIKILPASGTVPTYEDLPQSAPLGTTYLVGSPDDPSGFIEYLFTPLGPTGVWHPICIHAKTLDDHFNAVIGDTILDEELAACFQYIESNINIDNHAISLLCDIVIYSDFFIFKI